MSAIHGLASFRRNSAGKHRPNNSARPSGVRSLPSASRIRANRSMPFLYSAREKARCPSTGTMRPSSTPSLTASNCFVESEPDSFALLYACKPSGVNALEMPGR